jgi:hypothetical protein
LLHYGPDDLELEDELAAGADGPAQLEVWKVVHTPLQELPLSERTSEHRGKQVSSGMRPTPSATTGRPPHG